MDLVKNGIGSDLIVKIIGEQPSHFDLSSNGIIQLKRAGVPQTILRAMLDSRRPAPEGRQESKETQTSQPSARGVVPNYTWKTVSKADPMTGQTESSLFLDSPAVTEDGDRVGLFEVQATCDSSQLNIHLVYLADAKPGNGFKQNTTTYYETGGLLGAMANASHHKKAWTETRVRIGDQAPMIATSEADYLNESDLYFLDHDPRNPAGQDSGLALFATMLTANKPAGISRDFFSASRVLLESTFDNGTKAVMEVHPQDPSFSPFAEHCSSIGAVRKPDTAVSSGSQSSLSSSTSYDSTPRSTALPAPRGPIIVRGSTLTVTLPDPITGESTRSGSLIHAILADAMQSPTPPIGQKALALPAGTDIYLRARVIATAQQYEVLLDTDHVDLHGIHVPIRASASARTASREKIRAPSAINLGRYGRVNLPQNTAVQKNPALIKKGERITFSVSQPTFAPVSLAQ